MADDKRCLAKVVDVPVTEAESGLLADGTDRDECLNHLDHTLILKRPLLLLINKSSAKFALTVRDLVCRRSRESWVRGIRRAVRCVDGT